MSGSSSEYEEEYEYSDESDDGVVDLKYASAVVKIFTTVQTMDYDVPWRADRPDTCAGSGVCIRIPPSLLGVEPRTSRRKSKSTKSSKSNKSSKSTKSSKSDKSKKNNASSSPPPSSSSAPSEPKTESTTTEGVGYILTAAHVVADRTFVQVQKASDPSKAVAVVVAVSHEADLALLEIQAEDSPAGFTDDIPRAELGSRKLLPSLRTKISLVGYPIGGEEVSITDGVVSRVEVQAYTHSGRSLLAITVDAAMNSGNSGGPAFYKDKIIGIAIQGMDDAQNIGELVPLEHIFRFLEAFVSGKPGDIPAIGISCQNMEASQLRRAKGMAEEMTGVLVASVRFASSAYGVLDVGDVITAVNGHTIHNNGTILYCGKFRTSWVAATHRHFLGDGLPVSVWRDGESIDLLVPLKKYQVIVPRKQYDVTVRYFIYGGLVFQPLTRGLLATWNRWRANAPRDFVYHYAYGCKSYRRDEIVVFAGILSDSINVGYGAYEHSLVESVNGEPIRSLRDFVYKVETAVASGVPSINILTNKGVSLYFETQDVISKQPSILARYHVPADRSVHLLESPPTLKDTQIPEDYPPPPEDLSGSSSPLDASDGVATTSDLYPLIGPKTIDSASSDESSSS